VAPDADPVTGGPERAKLVWVQPTELASRAANRLARRGYELDRTLRESVIRGSREVPGRLRELWEARQTRLGRPMDASQAEAVSRDAVGL
jgi:hypothetical protein